MTLSAQLAAALTILGGTEIPSHSSRYRTFTRKGAGKGFYFVGRAGALRTGSCASRSTSVGESAKRAIIAAAAHCAANNSTFAPNSTN